MAERVQASLDDGRAYGRKPATFDAELAQVGPGTTGGELLRRYWQPFAKSLEATARPKSVRLLGEDLVLFRDGTGRPGLLYPRCMHRGTNLIYGKVEQCGIRCCYHGWLFDPEGRCLETPAEPGSRTKDRVRQPWYPVVEKFGLLFAYMGPADRQPQFPIFSIEENLQDDEQIVSFRSDTGPNGSHPKLAARADYNWWQMYDNWMDAFHVVVLHSIINGVQFVPSLGILPEVRFEYTEDGVISIQHRKLADGTIHQRVSQVIVPNMNCTAGVTDEDLGQAGISWTVPLDDTHFLLFGLSRTKTGSNTFAGSGNIGMLDDDWGPAHGKPFREWSLEDHQDWQTDYAAQKGQGDISLHSEEHLTACDRGTAMSRRLFRQQAQRVAKGEDPIGLGFDKPYRVEMLAGNALLDPQTGACIDGFAART